MNEYYIALLTITVTIVTYLFAKKLYNHFSSVLLLPVAVATFIIVILLIVFNIPYETYMIGGKWIKHFLGPAIVALAYPLYLNKDVLKKLGIQLIGGTFVGSIVGIITGIIFTRMLGFQDEIIYSMIPKSITIPIAMEVSSTLGGIDSLAAVFVVIAGISGAMLSSYIFKYIELEDLVGRGVGLGSASHALGTEKAFESSQLDGAISTVAMILSALFVSVFAPLLLKILI